MAKSKNAILAFSAIFIILPLLLNSEYLIQSIIMVLLYAYWATSWNMVGGFGGQLSLGHATFAGIGAYVSTVLLINYNLSPWIGMIIGGVIGSIFGIIIGYPTFRLKGSYYTLSTIAFMNVFMIFIITQDKVLGFETRGAEGLSVPWKGESFLGMEFLNKTYYYYIILVLLAVVLFVSYWIKNSKTGYYLAAINTNQDAADSLGVNVTYYKLKAQVLSCFFMAIGGSFYAQLITFIDPQRMLGYDLSVEVALVAIVGGRGTIVGPLIGAFLLEPLSQISRTYLGSTNAGLAVVIYGVIFMLTIYYFPDGLEKYVMRLFGFMGRKLHFSKSKAELR